MNALHSDRFDDIPLERFFQGYMPDDNGQGMSQRISMASKTSLSGCLVYSLLRGYLPKPSRRDIEAGPFSGLLFSTR